MLRQSSRKLRKQTVLIIPLTPLPCKTLERLIKKRIVEQLEKNKLICKQQHGFV